MRQQSQYREEPDIDAGAERQEDRQEVLPPRNNTSRDRKYRQQRLGKESRKRKE